MTRTEWPALPLSGWKPTYETLHLWTQIVGKITLALTPLSNHFWNGAFRMTARGFETPTLMSESQRLSITFDFVAHQLVITSADRGTETIPLAPRTVAAFHREVIAALERLGVTVTVWPMSVELPVNVRLDTDETHDSYDPLAAQAFWRAVLAMQPVFEEFRGRFVGKCSPVHFFWGSFDLAVSRFNGARAPERSETDPVMKRIMREAYSHEVISHGFWPGGGPVPEPVFYAYIVPEPDGFKTAAVRPEAAFYSAEMSEFLLPYEAVRTSSDPAASLLAFLDSTYNAAADLGNWERAKLER